MEFGIIVRIDWNENNWQSPSSYTGSNFRYVKETGLSHTAFNFAHNLYETEPDGYWYGLVPNFHSKTPDIKKTKDVRVVFMISVNEDKTFLVGLYAFPKFGKGIRKRPIPNFEHLNEVNIGAEPQNIYLLKEFIDLSNLDIKKVLGVKQELANMGWNYLSKTNVGYLLDQIDFSENNNSFKKIKFSILK